MVILLKNNNFLENNLCSLEDYFDNLYSNKMYILKEKNDKLCLSSLLNKLLLKENNVIIINNIAEIKDKLYLVCENNIECNVQ